MPDGGPVGLAAEETQLVEEAQAAGSVTRNLTAIPFVIGGLTFPVPPRAMKVKQEIKVDEADIPKKSGKVLQPTGYKPAEISVQLEIVPEEAGDGSVITSPMERLRPLKQLFRDGRASVPKPVSIVSPLTDLYGIRQVLIREMEADEDGDGDWIPVSLVLTEFESIKTQLENQAAAAAAANDAALEGAEAIAGSEELDRQLGYVRDQFNEGLTEGQGVETPEDDVAEPVITEGG